MCHLCLYGMTLEMTYFCAELVQLIVSWSDWELEMQRYGIEKILWVFDSWSYHIRRWTVKRREKLSPNCQSRFLKTTNCFWILRSVQFGFQKLNCNCTPLVASIPGTIPEFIHVRPGPKGRYSMMLFLSPSQQHNGTNGTQYSKIYGRIYL